MIDPTPEQIEAARDAMMRVGAGRFGISVVEHGMSILDAYGELARAALVAAAVAAPQPEDRAALVDAIAGGTITVPGGYGELQRDDAENIVDALLPSLAAPVQVDETKLAEAIAEELETDDAIAEEWSSGKLAATARRLAQFAVLPVLRGGGR